MDVIVVIKNEKAIKDRGEVSVIEGISTQVLEKPEKEKLKILNPGTIKVTIYKVIAEDIHLKIPNVRRFIGRRRRLITGLAKKEAIIIPNPASKRLSIPFSNIIPLTAPLMR